MSLTPRLDKIQKNYIINGDMRISQRATSFVSPSTGAYLLDRYQYEKSGAMVHTVTQGTDVPSLAQANILFANCMRLNLTTPDTSIAAGDFNFVGQKIEGYNFANFAQKDFTVSFWVKATLPGVYCIAARNGAQDMSYVKEYTINSADTWEQKTITFEASPAAGTWNYSNGTGIHITWALAIGATFQTTAGSWQAGNFLATANQVNGVNTGATDFRLTGICLYEGTLDTPKFSMFGGDFIGEIAACQRYYEKTYNLDVAPGTVTFTGAHSFNHPGGVGVEGNYYFRVTKRTNVNPVYYSPQTGASGVFRDTTSGVDRATATLRTGQNNIAFSTSGVPAGSPDLAGHIVADVEL